MLGANDGIVATASLIVGVAAASGPISNVLIAGVAGLVAVAMSRATGKYVSVSFQSDTEQADITREQAEIESKPEFEREELASLGGGGECNQLGQERTIRVMRIRSIWGSGQPV